MSRNAGGGYRIGTVKGKEPDPILLNAEPLRSTSRDSEIREAAPQSLEYAAKVAAETWQRAGEILNPSEAAPVGSNHCRMCGKDYPS